MHVGELGLFEVGSDKNVVQRDDRNQLLTDADVLSGLCASLTDDSVHWRAEDRVTQVELRLVKFSLAC